MKGHDGVVFTLGVMPGGDRIVTWSFGGTARIWDARTGQALSSSNGLMVWDLSKGKPVPPRYEAGTPDNMPIVGVDNFKVLQDQIDGLEKRVRELETKTGQTHR